MASRAAPSWPRSRSITEGHFGRHLRRMRQLYAERLSVLLECARQQLTGLLDLSPIEAGLETIGYLSAGSGGPTGEAAADAARTRNLEVTPLRRFYRGPMPRDGLQLGFATVSPRDIRRGVSDLAQILEQLRDSKRGRHRRRASTRPGELDAKSGLTKRRI
jgi:GntR family transcriptional regulator/MocR family aminotransferase